MQDVAAWCSQSKCGHCFALLSIITVGIPLVFQWSVRFYTIELSMVYRRFTIGIPLVGNWINIDVTMVNQSFASGLPLVDHSCSSSLVLVSQLLFTTDLPLLNH